MNVVKFELVLFAFRVESLGINFENDSVLAAFDQFSFLRREDWLIFVKFGLASNVAICRPVFLNLLPEPVNRSFEVTG